MDRSRFSFLTAREERDLLAVTVSDRVMLEVLRAVQVAQFKGQPARRISFRAADPEQIGFIYGGLLGHARADVDEVTAGLIGASGAEAELTLTTLEAQAHTSQDDAKFADAIVVTVTCKPQGATPSFKVAVVYLVDGLRVSRKVHA